MTHETAGDPMSGLKWTRRTTEKIAAELRSLGIGVGPRTVARLLTQFGVLIARQSEETLHWLAVAAERAIRADRLAPGTLRH